MAHAANKSVALWVVRVLRKAGFEALFAGGCVRDMLLGVRCTDYDIATSATPDQVRKLFRRVLLVGAQFGVAMVIVDRRRVEVTTFRSDQSYSDGRRPDHVTFTTAREDALRRDFTINGMFYDPVAREVIDYVGGREDLRRGVIRTIGRAEDRFGEDYLRLVRAVRFAVRLGFEIEPATAAAIRHHAPKITGISGERILDELSKMLAKPSAAQAIEKLHELGLAEHIMPELFAEKKRLTASLQTAFWARAVERVAAVSKRQDLTLALGAMLCELEGHTISLIVRRWGASNELRDDLKYLAGHSNDWMDARPAESLPRALERTMEVDRSRESRHARALEDTKKRETRESKYDSLGKESLSLADLKRLMAHRSFGRLLVLWRVEESLHTGKTTHARRLASRARAIPPERIAPAPLLTGMDLKRIGLEEGPRLGHILRTLYDAQLNEQIATRKEAFALAVKILRGKNGD